MKLSIIIPTRNRSALLDKTLSSIAMQSLNMSLFEVIVVDNGSTDNTAQVVKQYENKIKNIVYIFDDTPGLHVGRHRGLLEAKSDILVYADDDIEAFPSWLKTILLAFADDDVGMVGGKNLPNFESTPPQWLLEQWQKTKPQVLGALSILDFGNEIKDIDPYYIFGCNFSIRKQLLLDAGGFHPDGMPQEHILFRGDGETHVSKFVKDNKIRALYHPEASVYHFVPTDRMTKEYFKKRAYNQGISDSFTNARGGQRMPLLKQRLKLFIKRLTRHGDVAVDKAYLQGYITHQKAIKNNNKLYKWVMQSDYIHNRSIHD